MDIEGLERQEIKKKQRLVAGLFLLAIAMAMVFAYWMGAFGLGASRHVFVDYHFAGGLERGSTVRLAGIKVGRVSEIRFQNGSAASSESASVASSESKAESGSGSEGVAGQSQLRLKIEVNKDAFSQITDDSQFFINLAGLIGERYVEIVPGQGAQVKNAQIFRGSDPPRIDQLLSQGYGIFGDLRVFFQENKGDLKEMFNTLNSLSKNLANILDNVSPQQRRELTTLLSNFAVASSDLKSLMKNLNSGVEYADKHGAKQAWDTLHALLERANEIKINDIRRLMLEDGVRVRFGKNEVAEGTRKLEQSSEGKQK